MQLSAVPSFSQLPVLVGSIEPDEALAGAPITIRAKLNQGELIERVYLLFRSFGESQFQQLEMDLFGNAASVNVPSRAVAPPFFEYYFVFVSRSGVVESFPPSRAVDPMTTPPDLKLTMPVRGHDEKDVQILFLSPDPSDVLDPEEVIISISLLRADSIVVPRATRIYLDGADVTSFAVVNGDMLVLAPENMGARLSPGVHKVGVRLYGADGNLYRAAAHHFTVRGESGYQYTAPVSPAFKYNASVQFESRHERVAGQGTWYNRGGYQFSGRKGTWRLLSNAFITSDEKSDRQPQNRFFIGAESPWVSVGYGDSYPLFPNLLLSGKRVRGLNASVRLGAFNVDLAWGQTGRPIEGNLLASFPVDSLAAEQQRDPSAAYRPIDSAASQWGKFQYGTFTRNLFAIRPSFGSGETWQLGLTWLSSGDDVHSIRYGIRPAENVVLGMDLMTRIDGDQAVFTAQVAMSAQNSDISSGNFTDAYIDSVYPNNAEGIIKLRDVLSHVITVNENLTPLALTTPATLAYDAGLDLNYLDNALRLTYLYRGSNYTSFGQTFLRKDIRGFNVLDRIRLITNQVLLTLGFERLEDNTSKSKISTTRFTTVNTAVSYYAGRGIPGVTLGYTQYTNRNGVDRTARDSLAVINDVTNRFYVQTSYDVDLGAHHSLSLNVSTSARDDASPRNYDITNSTVFFATTSKFSVPLQTRLELGLNYNSLPDTIPRQSRRLDYTSLTLGGRYDILRDVIIIDASISPTFGDLKRTTYDASIEWYVLPAMSLALQFSYFRYADTPSDNYLSLRYRYDI
jgi:hypothetical protein